MRSGVVLALILGACGFRSPAGSIDSLDAAIPVDVSPPDAAAPFCDPADPHLVACYELEGDARDGSSHHLDAATTAAPFVTGRVGQAMQFGPGSVARVGDSPVFDIATLTIEAWIQPSLVLLSGRAGIMDVDHQYGFFLYPGSKLGCSTSGGGPTVDPVVTSIAVGRWSHVACTYDGAATIVYVDGAEVARKPGAATPSTTGTTGMSIAANNPDGKDPLTGLIDQVRLMNVARTAAEICADAGKSSCP